MKTVKNGLDRTPEQFLALWGLRGDELLRLPDEMHGAAIGGTIATAKAWAIEWLANNPKNVQNHPYNYNWMQFGRLEFVSNVLDEQMDEALNFPQARAMPIAAEAFTGPELTQDEFNQLNHEMRDLK